MQVNDAALAYERILEALKKSDVELAKALVGMGVPPKMVLGDPPLTRQDKVNPNAGDPYFKKHYAKWLYNMVDNYHALEPRSRIRKLCLGALPKSDVPVIVVGSGASLDGHIRLLQQWEGEIICGNSNFYTLLAHSITPTYVCVYDSHPRVGELMTGYKHVPKSVRLLTHVLINPAIVKKWRGPASYYTVRRPGILELFDYMLPLLFDRVGIESHMLWRICVVNNEVQMAGALGNLGRPIFLTGCDFGWKDRARSRCRTYEPTPDGEHLKEIPLRTITDDMVTGVDDEGWEFTGDMIVLRDELYKMWWQNHLPLVDCSMGSLTSFPQVPLEEVVAKQGRGYEWVSEKRREHSKRVADYLNNRMAVKQEQWLKILEARDALPKGHGSLESDGTVDAISGMVGGGGGEGPAGSGDTGA